VGGNGLVSPDETVQIFSTAMGTLYQPSLTIPATTLTFSYEIEKVDAVGTCTAKVYYTDSLGASYSASVALATNSASSNVQTLTLSSGTAPFTIYRITLNASGEERYRCFYVELTSPTFTTSSKVLSRNVVDEYVTMEGAIDAVRCVGASILVTDMSKADSKGGRLGAVINGGFGEFDSGLCASVDVISDRPGAWSGGMENGCYGVLLPQKESDLEMRNVWGIGNPMDQSTICVSGVVADPSVALIRVRAVHVWEVATTSSLLGPKPGPVSQAALDEAMSLMSSFPALGENPTHLRRIGKFLARAKKYVAKRIVPATVTGLGIAASRRSGDTVGTAQGIANMANIL